MLADIARSGERAPYGLGVKLLPVFAAAMLAAACGLTEPEGCDICTTSGVVDGRITHQDGSAVSGVQLDVRAFRDSCPPSRARLRPEGQTMGGPLPRLTDRTKPDRSRYSARSRPTASSSR